MPSVDAPWCCRTDSARVGKIQGSLSDGNRFACASMISSRVAPNMDGWNTEDCEQEMVIRPNKLKLLDPESFDFGLVLTCCKSILRKYIWVHVAVIIACATQNMLLLKPNRRVLLYLRSNNYKVHSRSLFYPCPSLTISWPIRLSRLRYLFKR